MPRLAARSGYPGYDGYRPGNAYFICDVCGQRFRRSQMLTRWDNLKVDARCNDPRPPQMFPPDIYPEGIPFPDARPPQDNPDRLWDDTALESVIGGFRVKPWGQIANDGQNNGPGSYSPQQVQVDQIPPWTPDGNPNPPADFVTLRTGPAYAPTAPIFPYQPQAYVAQSLGFLSQAATAQDRALPASISQTLRPLTQVSAANDSSVAAITQSLGRLSQTGIILGTSTGQQGTINQTLMSLRQAALAQTRHNAAVTQALARLTQSATATDGPAHSASISQTLRSLGQASTALASNPALITQALRRLTQAGNITDSPGLRPTITGTPQTGGMVGSAYGFGVYLAGGTPPYTVTVTSGALPDGVALYPFLNNANFRPVPTTPVIPDSVFVGAQATTTAGTFGGIVLTVTDSLGATNSLAPFSVTISPRTYSAGVIAAGLQAVWDLHLTAGLSGSLTNPPLPSGWTNGSYVQGGITYHTVNGTSAGALSNTNFTSREVHNKAGAGVNFNNDLFGYPNGLKAYYQGEGGQNSATTMTDCLFNGVGMLNTFYPMALGQDVKPPLLSGSLTLFNCAFPFSTPNQLLSTTTGAILVQQCYIGAFNIGANTGNHGEALNVRAGSLTVTRSCIDISAGASFMGQPSQPGISAPLWPNSLNGGVATVITDTIIYGVLACNCQYTVRGAYAGFGPNSVTVTGCALEKGTSGYYAHFDSGVTWSQSNNYDYHTGALITDAEFAH